jgi:hypothetical protein
MTMPLNNSSMFDMTDASNIQTISSNDEATTSSVDLWSPTGWRAAVGDEKLARTLRDIGTDAVWSVSSCKTGKCVLVFLDYCL